MVELIVGLVALWLFYEINTAEEIEDPLFINIGFVFALGLFAFVRYVYVQLFK